jgi:hypothetical protein
MKKKIGSYVIFLEWGKKKSARHLLLPLCYQSHLVPWSLVHNPRAKNTREKLTRVQRRSENQFFFFELYLGFKKSASKNATMSGFKKSASKPPLIFL